MIITSANTKEQKEADNSLPTQINRMEELLTKCYQLFRCQHADIDARLALLQNAKDKYYVVANYVLEIANKAYDLFKCSNGRKTTTYEVYTIEH